MKATIAEIDGNFALKLEPETDFERSFMASLLSVSMGSGTECFVFQGIIHALDEELSQCGHANLGKRTVYSSPGAAEDAYHMQLQECPICYGGGSA